MPSLRLLRKPLATNEAGPSSGACATQLRKRGLDMVRGCVV
ncbi:hypothetical protein V6Z12_1Z015000 [Gossypium hirsutum]